MSSDADLTFIETQFPVSKLSKESYKERMGNSSQTLTGLGKWWGRKPLVLVRAWVQRRWAWVRPWSVCHGLVVSIRTGPKARARR